MISVVLDEEHQFVERLVQFRFVTLMDSSISSRNWLALNQGVDVYNW